MTTGQRTQRISTRNSAYQVFESLRTNRQKRRATGTFLVEGVRPLTLALDHGWTFEAVLHEHGRKLSAWAAGVLERTRPATRYTVESELFRALCGRDEGSEILGVVRMRRDDPAEVAARPDLLVAVMDRPASPGNLGTLIRSCDALGVHALVITGHAADPYDPATITASRGSLFALPVVRLASHADVGALVARVREACGHCRVIAADEKGAVPLDEADLSRPLVAVFGNETYGVSRAYVEMADALVRIPMAGAASSLNVSIAASIVLYEASRQAARTPRV